ncbi:unnamed protein product [Pylaiella littoralis]
MLPSARRAELSREYFDNSYLSRKAFEGGGEGVAHAHDHAYGGGGRDGDDCELPSTKCGGSSLSRTTAGLTTFDDDVDGSRFGGGGGGGRGGRSRLGGHGERLRNQRDLGAAGLSPQHHQRQTTSSFKDVPDYESDFSEDDSLGSMLSEESQGVSTTSRSSVLDTAAGQIWGMLCSLDDLVLEVKGNVCQCQRLGARLAALKKPMVAVHRGRQAADHAVLSTIKDLVTEAQRFMERFLDPYWWRKGAGHKEESEMFRELTFRLGFLMQAPPGFQKQSQEEDNGDRLKDMADLQSSLEGTLRRTKDERLANDIMQVLSRLRLRTAVAEGTSPEIDFENLVLSPDRRSPDNDGLSLGNGGFGTVFAASLNARPVAVKRLNNQNVRPELLQGMRREIQAFHALKFDFVVKTLGACTVRPNLCIVQERAQTSLYNVLHEPDLYAPLPTEEKAAMLYDIARGLQYLHIKKITHGNVKSTNVLVFENNCLKVSDFGLIAVRESQSGHGGGDTVPSAAWTAPEVLDDQDPSHLSDVYSFGILTHEVLTQRVPFAGKSVAKVITAVVAKGHRPGYLEGEEATFPRGLVKLADVCWTQDPAARPRSLIPIVTELGHIVHALGRDPRPKPYAQCPGESALTTPTGELSAPSPSSARERAVSRAKMTEQERRINDLEEELRALKMSEGMSGGGRDLMFRNQVEGSGGRRGGSGCGGIVAGARSKGSSAENGVPEERNALRALYTATQGPGWIKQAGWETNAPDLSSWYGVVCGEGGHVIGLQLPSNNLQAGQIPHELVALTRVKVMVLSDNLLEGPLPAEFGSFFWLTELDLSMNDLTGAIPASLSNALSLERLFLQCNGLAGIVPRSLQKLKNLKVFVADWRDLCDTHPFRKFRKASPAPTQAEIERAMSETRTAARERSLVSSKVTTAEAASARNRTTGGAYGAATPVSPMSRANSGMVSGNATPSAASTPLRGRFPMVRKFMGGPGSSTSRQSSPSAEMRNVGGRFGVDVDVGLAGGGGGGGGRGRGRGYDGGAWGGGRVSGSNSNSLGAQFPAAAPTAPYRGEDGMQSKAKAKAEANAPPPSRRWKHALSSAGKVFKEVVGGDLHPGYTNEGARVQK